MTTRGHSARAARTMSATCRTASALPTDVPPNFMTNVFAIRRSSIPHRIPDTREAWKTKTRGRAAPRLVEMHPSTTHHAEAAASREGLAVIMVVVPRK
jgi:hypothetical protein